MKERTQDRIVVGILAIFCLPLVAAIPATVTSLTTYDSVADMAAYHNPKGLFKTAHVRGYYAPGDGGGGMYVVTNSVTSTNLGGRIFALQGGGTYSFDAVGSDISNVRRWGAKGDGTTDDTAAVTSRYNALSPTEGGEIYLPEGKWKLNFPLILKPNVTIRGVSHFRYSSGSATAGVLVPAITNAYVIQVGNDTARVRGVVIRDLTFDGQGATGGSAIYLAGGAIETTISDVCINFFNAVGVKVQGGATYEASKIHFSRVHGTCPAGVANTRGFLIVNSASYPTGATTEINFDNCSWDGPTGTGSYLFEIDSCEIKWANCYFDVTDGHGVLFSHNVVTPLPKLDANNSNVDGGAGTSVAIQGYTNNRNYTGISGVNFQVSGRYLDADTTPVTNSFAPFTIPSSIFRKGVAAKGELQILNDDGGNSSRLAFVDNVGKNLPDFFAQGATINLRPGVGGTLRIADNAGTTWGEVNTNGWFIYSGGIAANTSLYFDSLKRIKSAPTGTATLDFPSTAAQTSSELTITATGAVVGDCVILGVPATANANTCYTARVSAADTVTVKFNNYSSGAVDPASGSFKVTVLK